MKYIKKLNIDFDQWGELNKGCTYLIFKSGSKIYLGYIVSKYKSYNLYLLNGTVSYNINIIHNVKKIDNIYYKKPNNRSPWYNGILYKNLIKSNFYKKNKILIIGIDINKEELLNNINSYVNNCPKKIVNL